MPEWSTPIDEGQLSVDVFRDKNDLVIRSTVAGAKPDDLDIAIHGDLLTIRGRRESEHDITEDNWFYRECYWGNFSRSIVLPYEVTADKASAALKNGVLEIRVPISQAAEKSIRVRVEE